MSDIADGLPSREEFSEHVNSAFQMRLGEGSAVDFCLVGVDDIVSNAVQENYALTFLAPLDTQPAQGIYRLDHETLGELEIFLVPVKKDESGLYLEAVFNRFISQ